MSSEKRKVKVCILGAGNVASHLTRALSRVGHSVAVWNRSEAPLVPLRQELGIPCSTDLNDIPQDADAYIIAVKDDAVAAVARCLFMAVGKTKAIVAHTAGSLPKELLAEHFERIGVFYPMQTFSKGKALDYSKIPFFIEEKGDILHALARTISESVYSLGSEERKVLHLASVFACNFTNHCYAIADHLLRDIDIPFSAMLPLINETTAKVAALPPCEAQTGPAVREDHNVLAAHIHLLDAHPDWRELYIRISNSIIQCKYDND